MFSNINIPYFLISFTILILAIIRYKNKKIRLVNFIILSTCAFIPTVNAGLLASYLIFVVILKGDKTNPNNSH